MSVLKRGFGALMTARPYVQRLVDVDQEAKQRASIAVFPGDEVGTRFLRGVLGTGPDSGETDLVLWAPGADVEREAEALARRKRQGAAVRALLVGSPARRRELERAIGIGDALEVSDTIQIASLSPAGAQRAGVGIAHALGDQALAAGRQRPALRASIARWLVGRSARRAAAVGAVGIAGSGYAVISAIQMRMVASLAAMCEQELDAQTAADTLAIFSAGYGLRTIARFGARGVPFAGPVVYGGVAYVGTRAVGELAFRRFSAGEPLVADIPAPAQSAVQQVIERLPGTDSGQSERSEG